MMSAYRMLLLLSLVDFTQGQDVTTLATTAYTLGSDLLYPYGSGMDKLSPQSDDGGPPIISLPSDVPFYGEMYSSFYLNNNGFLSFKVNTTAYQPPDIAASYGHPFLAPFWSDVDNTQEGSIYYRQTTDSNLLAWATSQLKKYFRLYKFNASWAFVATWESVLYHGSKSPEAALCNGNGTSNYTLSNSLKNSMSNLMSGSNVNKTGRWAFNIDSITINFTDTFMDLSITNTTSEMLLAETTTEYALVDASSSDIASSPLIYSTTSEQANSTLVDSSPSEKGLLYPYGPGIDTIMPMSGCGGPLQIPLDISVPIFGNWYSSLYMDNNGILSFNESITARQPQGLPLSCGAPFLAVFWSDIDNSLGGDIYYRHTCDPELLALADSEINTYFQLYKFNAQWMFIATWDQVPYYGSTSDKVNTFQVVLITDGILTFVMYNYKDIQWPSMDRSGTIIGPEALQRDCILSRRKVLENGPACFARLLSSVSDSQEIKSSHQSSRYDYFTNLTTIFCVILPSNDKAHVSSTGEMLDALTVTPTETTKSAVLYPWDKRYDNQTPKSDDGGSPIIFLLLPLPLFGKMRWTFFVNNNGLLSFNVPVTESTPQDLPVCDGTPFLAPFWADVDNTRGGDIYYRQSFEADLLSRATSDVRAYFNKTGFRASWVFIGTWYKVAFYASSSNKVNTFQVVLITDWKETFVLFNYEGIEWTSGTFTGGNKETGLGGIPALAGLNSGYKTGYYKIPNSLTPNIINLNSTSNVDVPGRWAFRVDQLKPEDPKGILADFIKYTTTSSSSSLLYPYGNLSYDNITPKEDDGTRGPISLSTPLTLFGNVSSIIYVNNNGLLSFNTSISAYTPQKLPKVDGNPFLAPFWADVDNAIAGDIYYRQNSNDADLLNRATSDISSYFSLPTFSATWVFVATWSNVSYYGSSSSSSTVNTFQAVLITNGSLTFVMFNYADIQWTTGTASGGNLKGTGGTPALAGLNSGYNTGYYQIDSSLTSDIINISTTSNVDVTGRWVFRVDKLHPQNVSGIIGKKKKVYLTK
ncbi:uncharacterized protein ACMZJ9_019034 [Mantella aurantiaca]